MTGILQNYLPLVVFIGVASLIGLALLIAPFLVAFQQPDPEKLSAYECGFNAFDDARMARAPIFAARKPRCWRAWKARKASRG